MSAAVAAVFPAPLDTSTIRAMAEGILRSRKGDPISFGDAISLLVEQGEGGIREYEAQEAFWRLIASGKVEMLPSMSIRLRA